MKFDLLGFQFVHEEPQKQFTANWLLTEPHACILHQLKA